MRTVGITRTINAVKAATAQPWQVALLVVRGRFFTKAPALSVHECCSKFCADERNTQERPANV
jgi:hypothetical protein